LGVGRTAAQRGHHLSMKDYGGQVKANEAYTGGIFVGHGPDTRQRSGYGERVLPPRPAAEHSHPFGWDWTQGTAIPPLRMSRCLLAIASSAARKLLHKTDGHPRGRWRGIACMVCGPHKPRTQLGETGCKSLSGKGFFVRLMAWRLSDMPPKTAS
jgi:hypothetical protein